MIKILIEKEMTLHLYHDIKYKSMKNKEKILLMKDHFLAAAQRCNRIKDYRTTESFIINFLSLKIHAIRIICGLLVIVRLLTIVPSKSYPVHNRGGI